MSTSTGTATSPCSAMMRGMSSMVSAEVRTSPPGGRSRAVSNVSNPLRTESAQRVFGSDQAASARF